MPLRKKQSFERQEDINKKPTYAAIFDGATAETRTEGHLRMVWTDGFQALGRLWLGTHDS